MRLIAHIYLDAGRFEESVAWHEKIFRATPNRDPWWITTYARALQGAGKLEEAERLLRRNLERVRNESDRRTRERGIAILERILGLNLLLQGRYPEAEPVAREALAIMEKETPDAWDFWSLFHSMSLVGGSLLGQQRYEEAEPFLVRGYAGMKEREALINAGFMLWLRQAGERLARYYEETHQPGKARRLREELRSAPDTK
jgi:tetratricopeptide (TPR) repeat protein